MFLADRQQGFKASKENYRPAQKHLKASIAPKLQRKDTWQSITLASTHNSILPPGSTFWRGQNGLGRGISYNAHP